MRNVVKDCDHSPKTAGILQHDFDPIFVKTTERSAQSSVTTIIAVSVHNIEISFGQHRIRHPRKQD
jgi:hypothetical protein